MKKILLFLLVFILSANLNAQEDPLVEKIKNIKELYEMNVISKKEYDSITNILVKDLLNKESKSSIKPQEVNLGTSTPQNNSFDSETETPVNNDLIQNDEDEYIPFIENSWGLSVGYSSVKEKLEAYGLSETVEGNSWSIGFVNRWGDDNVKWQSSFSYGQTKAKDIQGAEAVAAVGVGIESLIYLDPIAAPGLFFSIGIGAAQSLEEKIDGIKQLGFSIGGGLGIDIDELFTISAGYGTNLTNPYEGDLSDLKGKSGAFGLGVILRF
jgi:hypothetical protein